jgi:hypothetical protein
MSFNSRAKQAQNAKAITVLTGAAPQVGAGNTVTMGGLVAGTLSAHIEMSVKTSTLTETPSWQVSDDNTNWYDVKVSNNAANVATAAGTGATVTTKVDLQAPASVHGHKYARAIVTTAVGVGDGVNDAYLINYAWLQDGGF